MILVDNITVTIDKYSYSGNLTIPYVLEVGATYTLTVDDFQEDVAATQSTDVVIIQSSDGGFTIQQPAGGGDATVFCRVAGNHTISIAGDVKKEKQIDEKFIPKTNPLILYVFVDGFALKNKDKREPVCATVEEIRQAFLGAGVYTTPATDDVGELGSLSQVIYFDPASAKIATKDSIYSINLPA